MLEADHEAAKLSSCARFAVLNDFAAVGYGVPAVPADDLVALNDAPVAPEVLSFWTIVIAGSQCVKFMADKLLEQTLLIPQDSATALGSSSVTCRSASDRSIDRCLFCRGRQSCPSVDC